MNFKVLKITLAIVLMTCSVSSFSKDVVTSEAALKSSIIEKELNLAFTKALSTAATKLDAEGEMTPFAIILRRDSTLGFFEVEKTPETKKLSVNDQVFGIRRYLTELALAGQIKATVLGMYVSISNGTEVSQQGISFEIEHLEGVAMLRFIPVSEKVNTDKPNTIVIHTESISTTIKHAMVFTEMAKIISRQD